MPCFHPLKGWRSRTKSSNGKRPVVFNVKQGNIDQPVQVPCGQCIGCRLERSRQWAIRCVHEASLYDNNCFITLTYNDENLPPDQSLDVSVFQKFMKRLRKRFGPDIRFYHCGEYGEKYGRPHYHACLFNFDFPDKILWKMSNGHKLYTSEALQELWRYGYSSIGDVTFESAAYCARYIMKKINGDMAKEHYETINPYTGEITQRKPEYTTMSRRPGIGRGWLEKYQSDVYPDDHVVLRGGIEMRPPKYYDRVYEAENSDFDAIKGKRVYNAKKHSDNNTKDRLNVREKCAQARLNQLKRTVD